MILSSNGWMSKRTLLYHPWCLAPVLPQPVRQLHLQGDLRRFYELRQTIPCPCWAKLFDDLAIRRSRGPYRDYCWLSPYQTTVVMAVPNLPAVPAEGQLD